EEAGVHIGYVLGLLDTTVYFGLPDFEFCLADFGPLVERTIPCALQVGRKTIHAGCRVYTELRPHVPAEQVVELFLLCGEFIREIERLIFCFSQARSDIEARIL